MGLDMYLERRTYVKNWDHMEPEERHEVAVKLGGAPHPHIKPERVSEIVEQVAYWRKANAIHRWFVLNVQDGEDDCQTSHVSREKLFELVDACTRVLASLELVPGKVDAGTVYHGDGRVEERTRPGMVASFVETAQKILPTQSGFFFGGTDYDEGYAEDLRRTIEQLGPLLAEPDDRELGSLYYRASW